MEKYTFASNIGNISIFIDKNKVYALELNSKNDISSNNSAFAQKIVRNIVEYLNGSSKSIHIPYFIEGTQFQTDVLEEIANIKYGDRISYKELARRAGYPNASRACGTVCKLNKLPLIIPCHRVVKSNGLIGEYNGGMQIKKILLELENKI